MSVRITSYLRSNASFLLLSLRSISETARIFLAVFLQYEFNLRQPRENIQRCKKAILKFLAQLAELDDASEDHRKARKADQKTRNAVGLLKYEDLQNKYQKSDNKDRSVYT